MLNDNEVKEGKQAEESTDKDLNQKIEILKPWLNSYSSRAEFIEKLRDIQKAVADSLFIETATQSRIKKLLDRSEEVKKIVQDLEQVINKSMWQRSYSFTDVGRAAHYIAEYHKPLDKVDSENKSDYARWLKYHELALSLNNPEALVNELIYIIEQKHNHKNKPVLESTEQLQYAAALQNRLFATEAEEAISLLKEKYKTSGLPYEEIFSGEIELKNSNLESIKDKSAIDAHKQYLATQQPFNSIAEALQNRNEQKFSAIAYLTAIVISGADSDKIAEAAYELSCLLDETKVNLGWQYWHSVAVSHNHPFALVSELKYVLTCSENHENTRLEDNVLYALELQNKLKNTENKSANSKWEHTISNSRYKEIFTNKEKAAEYLLESLKELMKMANDPEKIKGLPGNTVRDKWVQLATRLQRWEQSLTKLNTPKQMEDWSKFKDDHNMSSILEPEVLNKYLALLEINEIIQNTNLNNLGFKYVFSKAVPKTVTEVREVLKDFKFTTPKDLESKLSTIEEKINASLTRTFNPQQDATIKETYEGILKIINNVSLTVVETHKQPTHKQSQNPFSYFSNALFKFVDGKEVRLAELKQEAEEGSLLNNL